MPGRKPDYYKLEAETLDSNSVFLASKGPATPRTASRRELRPAMAPAKVSCQAPRPRAQGAPTPAEQCAKGSASFSGPNLWEGCMIQHPYKHFHTQHSMPTALPSHPARRTNSSVQIPVSDWPGQWREVLPFVTCHTGADPKGFLNTCCSCSCYMKLAWGRRVFSGDVLRWEDAHYNP